MKIKTNITVKTLFLFLVIPLIAKEPTLEPLPEVSIPKDNPQTKAKIELGKLLYFDPRLSGDGSTSCATCHDPNQGFAKSTEMSPAYPGNKHFRHSPTVLNSAYNDKLFWDGRANSLEEQAEKPIASPFEMNMNYDLLEERLKSIPKYVEMFKKAFPGEKEPITIKNIAKAIAAFERTLITPNSPFDRYLRGEKNALNPQQVKGLEIFKGKANCIQCHNGPNLTDNQLHITGVPKAKIEDDSQVQAVRRFVLKTGGIIDYENYDRDPGAFASTKDKKQLNAFKTPSLRNVAITPPYMHNGVFKTLDEVIEFYNNGGGDIRNKDPKLKRLNLTKEEKEALKAFLHSLTGEIPEVEEPELPQYK
ncbi:MAG: cytochrome c551 peroxidase [Leptospiraceae bacterium]|nr:MAG: cytochrome c551 peroxidase [Leptospiraceae bacterium]